MTKGNGYDAVLGEISKRIKAGELDVSARAALAMAIVADLTHEGQEGSLARTVGLKHVELIGGYVKARLDEVTAEASVCKKCGGTGDVPLDSTDTDGPACTECGGTGRAAMTPRSCPPVKRTCEVCKKLVKMTRGPASGGHPEVVRFAVHNTPLGGRCIGGGSEPTVNGKRCALCQRADVVGGPKMVVGNKGETLCWECK